jgi:hypothetical protein
LELVAHEANQSLFKPIVEDYLNMAKAAFALDQLDVADKILVAAVTESERFGLESIDVARTARAAASMYMRNEMFDRALPMLNRSLQVYLALRSDNKADVAMVLMDLADLALSLSRPRGALQYVKRAESILRNAKTVDVETSAARERVARVQFIAQTYITSVAAPVKVPTVRTGST